MDAGTDAGTIMGNAMNGQALYTQRGCNGCHGVNAEGSASGPNITGNAMAGIGTWTQDQFSKAVREGIDDDGTMLCTTMPRTPSLTATQLADLFAFVKSKDSAVVQKGPCP